MVLDYKYDGTISVNTALVMVVFIFEILFRTRVSELYACTTKMWLDVLVVCSLGIMLPTVSSLFGLGDDLGSRLVRLNPF